MSIIRGAGIAEKSYLYHFINKLIDIMLMYKTFVKRSIELKFQFVIGTCLQLILINGEYLIITIETSFIEEGESLRRLHSGVRFSIDRLKVYTICIIISRINFLGMF